MGKAFGIFWLLATSTAVALLISNLLPVEYRSRTLLAMTLWSTFVLVFRPIAREVLDSGKKSKA